jgi:glyceraldehyde 3-phosphate dehydrogenase
MIKVAINGFGRIGRLAFREILKSTKMEVVAINDLSTPSISVYAERSPQNLPWAKHNVDLVLECTGIFESKEKASMHLSAGAQKVIISAPSDKDVKTIVYNVNHNILQNSDRLISCASCTTNCLAPMAKVLDDNFGIITGQMTTIHAYTNSQPLMDTPDPKANYRKSRAAANNIVPYTTGAAKAIGLVIPGLKGRLDGSSQRVPVHSGSVVELFTILQKKVTAEEINETMKSASNESYGYTEDPIVSSDVIGISFGSLFDATLTKVVTADDKQLVKTVAWYDNEMSFVSQMIRTAEYFGKLS